LSINVLKTFATKDMSQLIFNMNDIKGLKIEFCLCAHLVSVSKCSKTLL
jgi:hypothetical protein